MATTSERKRCASDYCDSYVEGKAQKCGTCKKKDKATYARKQRQQTDPYMTVDLNEECSQSDMALITEMNSTIVESLQQLMRSNEVTMEKKNGVVVIDSKYEVYIKFNHDGKAADARSDKLFRTLPEHEKMLEVITKVLIPIATKLVQRMSKHKPVGWVFHSWAILFSEKGVCIQIPHIDSDADEYQFFFPLGTATVPSTLVYKGKQVTREEAAKFVNIPGFSTHTIEYYSNLLQNRVTLCESMKPVNENGWAPGILACMHGGVVHAGPQHSEPRAVLFFVATPEKSSGCYSGDSQFHTWSVISNILMNDAYVTEDVENNAEKINHLESAHARVMMDWLPEMRKREADSVSLPGSWKDSLELFHTTRINLQLN